MTVTQDETAFWLGPKLSSMIIGRHRDLIQGATDFVQALKYAHMTHFFANPLSILLDIEKSGENIQSHHYEAIRNLPSFRDFVEDALDRHDYEAAQKLLEDDSFLFEVVTEKLKSGRESMNGIVNAIDLIVTLQCELNIKENASWSDLYVKAMSGRLRNSVVVKEIILSLKRIPSEKMKHILGILAANQVPDAKQMLQTLVELTDNVKDNADALRSTENPHQDTLRTTVVSQKVELKKSAVTLSKTETAYSDIVKQVDRGLRAFFDTFLLDHGQLFANEIFIFDSKSPHVDAFTPAPRLAVERALNSPHDYLGCECCGSSKDGLPATQPATAILYQLYLESGALLNIADLWSAFTMILQDDASSHDEAEQDTIL